MKKSEQTETNITSCQILPTPGGFSSATASTLQTSTAKDSKQSIKVLQHMPVKPYSNSNTLEVQTLKVKPRRMSELLEQQKPTSEVAFDPHLSKKKVFRQQKPLPQVIKMDAEAASKSYKRESVFYRQMFNLKVWYYNCRCCGCGFNSSQALDCCCQTFCCPIMFFGQCCVGHIKAYRFPLVYCCVDCFRCDCAAVGNKFSNTKHNCLMESICCCSKQNTS